MTYRVTVTGAVPDDIVARISALHAAAITAAKDTGTAGKEGAHGEAA
jgi:hypothetical protein